MVDTFCECSGGPNWGPRPATEGCEGQCGGQLPVRRPTCGPKKWDFSTLSRLVTEEQNTVETMVNRCCEKHFDCWDRFQTVLRAGSGVPNFGSVGVSGGFCGVQRCYKQTKATHSVVSQGSRGLRTGRNAGPRGEQPTWGCRVGRTKSLLVGDVWVP